MRYIKIGVSGLNAAQLVTKANNIIEKMTDNANFATPNPTLADFTTAKVELAEAISAASAGDRNAIFHRNVKADNMTRLIRLMSNYVTSIGEGDGDILVTSGFELKKEPEPMAPVTTPIDFLAQRTDVAGSVKLNWKAVKGARSYVIEMSKQDPIHQAPVWEQVLITTHARALFDDLTLGTYYWFRVRCVGKSNKSGWSNLSDVLVA